ncbi:MAG: hypothetical protein U0625_13000 [Phycisphaerales bacterium]
MPYASNVIGGLNIALMYAENLTKSIPADKFAHFPGKDIVCPAFYIGHLSLYSGRVLGMLQRPELIVPNPAGWDDRFKAGVEAQPGEYPSKDELLGHFFTGYRAIAKALETAPDSVFEQDNPAEGRMKEMFPKLGGAITFLCIGHTQMHLGQISTWRRVMGLGSAM